MEEVLAIGVLKREGKDTGQKGLRTGALEVVAFSKYFWVKNNRTRACLNLDENGGKVLLK